jgi:hypothetical protein
MNILRWLDKLFRPTRLTKEEMVGKYVDVTQRLSKAKTLGDLFQIKKELDELHTLAIEYRWQWMRKKNKELRSMWVLKYKLWKSRG